jgi:YqaJ-like viral recombinase domain
MHIRISGSLIKKLEDTRIRKNEQRQERRQDTIKYNPKKFAGPDEHYGSTDDIEIGVEEYAVRVKSIIGKLEENQTRREDVFTETLGQSSNPQWFHYRNSLLTASNFGLICKRRKQDCSIFLKNLLKKQATIPNQACLYGLEAEPLAREHVEQLLDIKKDECGLMIDFATPYLACSPDGIISDGKGIVEIKCPAYAKDMTISEAIKNKKIDYLEVVNNEVKNLKQNHNYHFQVQGQHT